MSSFQGLIGWLTFVANQPLFFMILTINGKQAALKKGSSIEYVSENRIFTDADDYSMENLRENEVFRHDFCYLCNQNNMKVE